jgi:RimJ/RimL family protein N-acetyltransferase
MTLLDRTAPETLRQRSIPVLETARLTLRAPRFEDAEAIATLVNDRRIAENTSRIPHPYGLADAQAFLTAANTDDGEITFLISSPAALASEASGQRGNSLEVRAPDTRPEPGSSARDGGSIVGCCGIAKLDGETPEIGYWLGVAFWGKGYATESARALIDHAFGELRYDTLLAGARVSNPASRRVLEKCGFQWTGVGLYRIRALASSAPCDRFRLDRGLWASLKSWGK